MQLTPEEIRQSLEQIKWQRYREGNHSSQDPLLSIQSKLRNMKDTTPRVTLDRSELQLLLDATTASIEHISIYDYGLDTVHAETMRQKTIAPILALACKIRTLLTEETVIG